MLFVKKLQEEYDQYLTVEFGNLVTHYKTLTRRLRKGHLSKESARDTAVVIKQQIADLEKYRKLLADEPLESGKTRW